MIHIWLLVELFIQYFKMSSTTLSQEISEEKSQQRITGRVKWFNNKVGFGFVTAVEGDLKEKDVFVHYSSINVPDDQYKYLVQGEYVDFELTDSEKSDHEFHAINISGVKGGNLMCETRRLSSETRPYKPRVYKTPDDSSPRPVEIQGAFGRKDDVGTLHENAASTESAPRKKYTSAKRVGGPTKDAEGYTKVPVRKPKTVTVNAASASK
jgi:CspA family cold shock protein